MINCTAMDIASFLLRHENTFIDIHLESITLINGDQEVGGWPWLVKVVRDAFFKLEDCGDKHSASLLSLEDRHRYYNEQRELLKATGSKGLDDILRLLRKRA